jgi:hypothetical protein
VCLLITVCLSLGCKRVLVMDRGYARARCSSSGTASTFTEGKDAEMVGYPAQDHGIYEGRYTVVVLNQPVVGQGDDMANRKVV